MKAYQEFEIDYFQDEDGLFTAQVRAIPGCIASGKTLHHAYRNAVEAIESCVEARRNLGISQVRT
jgi:predicted RNase H-like HicB family nuclease